MSNHCGLALPMDHRRHTPYDLLGVTPDATAIELKTAYRKAVLRLHTENIRDEYLSSRSLYYIKQAYCELLERDHGERPMDDLELQQDLKEFGERTADLPPWRDATYLNHSDHDRFDPYQVLKVPPCATPAQIRTAYKKEAISSFCAKLS